MAMGTLDRSTVRLIPDSLTVKQNVDMSIFLITDWDLKPVGKVLSTILIMKRKITFFASLLLIAITFATTFFKPFFFEAALSVNLMNMLVITTIFIGKMERLPPMSDIRMIDIWLVFRQLVPFVEVVLLTAMEYHREDTEETTENEIEVLPVIDKSLDLEKSREEMTPYFLARSKTLNFHFSFYSRFSRFLEQISISLLNL